ncbi:MAG: DUF998 domain-containing protein [Desulfurococcaceae archaeon TW002]
MSFGKSIIRYLRYSGLLSFMIAYVFIIISILINPWFSFFKNALSDLGRVDLENSYVFNMGLVLAGLISLTYIPSLLIFFRSRIGYMSTGVFLVAILHLILIGVFPEGTSPHGFVSYEFFALMTISLLLVGISLIVERLGKYGFIFIMLFLLSLIGSLFIAWPSVALLELYNIVLYNVGIAILTYLQSKKSIT